MPQGWRASSFMAACERRGVLVKPADEFALPNDRAPNAIRLSIGTCVSDCLFRSGLEEINDLLANPQSRIDN
jgi:DNA-binding transcriptional MocR family regulator